MIFSAHVNLLVGTLKPCRATDHYTAIRWLVYTLAVDVLAVTFGTARRGLGRAAARPGSSSLYQM